MKMFAIVASILFLLFANVQSAPASADPNAPPWAHLKDDQSLQRFRSTLLNETLLTFLTDCYPPKLTGSRQWAPCSRYYDGVLQLNNTDFVVNQPEVLKILSESTTYKDFCRKNHSFPIIKYYKTAAKNFSDMLACGYLCTLEMENSDFATRPICVFLSWMGEQLEKAYQAPAGNKPMLPAHGAADIEVPPGIEPSKGLAETKPANQDTHMPASDVNGTQPLRPPNVPPIQLFNKQANITHTPAEEETKPKVSTPAEPAKPLVPDTNIAAVPVEKEEHQAQESQEKLPPTGNHEMQGEETPIKDTENPAKHDLIPPLDTQANEDPFNRNESDDDQSEDQIPDDNDTENAFENNLDKNKSIDAPIVNPEDNEVNQKSQEIIDSNYLPNSKRVIDPFLEESGSNFFTYFLIGMFLCIAIYVAYHNKSKILALLLEGRRSDKGRGRRKHTAAYRKLDSNLEEAITSSASGRTTQIIY